MSPHADTLTWRTSSYSGTEVNCVQIAADDARTHVRDSKNPTGATLVFPATTFTAFLATR